MKPAILSLCKIICCIVASALAGACAQTNQSPTIETIVVTPSISQEKFFSDFVSSIEIIPLETKEDLFIRNKRVLEVYKDDFYISNVDNGLRDDSRGESNIILRFDKAGKFLNKIGHFSRSGTNTYFFFTNYYLDSIAYIFSFPNFCVNKYTLSGEFISKDTLVSMEQFKPAATYTSEFKQAALCNDTYVVNVDSYSEMDDHMLMLCNKQGDILSKQIHLKTKLRRNYSRKPNFTKYKNTLLYRDEYKDTIYQISEQGNISPRVSVVYSEQMRSNKENYIKIGKNSLAAHEEYEQKPFANNNLYYESDEYCLLEIDESIPTPKGISRPSRLALKNKQLNHVAFVDFNTENTTFKDAVQFLDGKKLYFLVQARHLTTIAQWMKPYFVNLPALENIKPEDNDIVFIFNLK